MWLSQWPLIAYVGFSCDPKMDWDGSSLFSKSRIFVDLGYPGDLTFRSQTTVNLDGLFTGASSLMTFSRLEVLYRRRILMLWSYSKWIQNGSKPADRTLVFWKCKRKTFPTNSVNAISLVQTRIFGVTASSVLPETKHGHGFFSFTRIPILSTPKVLHEQTMGLPSAAGVYIFAETVVPSASPRCLPAICSLLSPLCMVFVIRTHHPVSWVDWLWAEVHRSNSHIQRISHCVAQSQCKAPYDIIADPSVAQAFWERACFVRTRYSWCVLEHGHEEGIRDDGKSSAIRVWLLCGFA